MVGFRLRLNRPRAYKRRNVGITGKISKRKPKDKENNEERSAYGQPNRGIAFLAPSSFSLHAAAVAFLESAYFGTFF